MSETQRIQPFHYLLNLDINGNKQSLVDVWEQFGQCSLVQPLLYKRCTNNVLRGPLSKRDKKYSKFVLKHV